MGGETAVMFHVTGGQKPAEGAESLGKSILMKKRKLETVCIESLCVCVCVCVCRSIEINSWKDT